MDNLSFAIGTSLALNIKQRAGGGYQRQILI
jgi:hypothetical protein